VNRVRPSFEEIYLDLARIIAQRSTCSRLQVGTVITSSDFRKVLAIGYNGNASGLPNCCDRTTEGNCGCLHSEENAVINCDSPRSEEKIVFVTHHPCAACAKRLINLGNVKKIYFAQEYRSTAGAELLQQVGIELVKGRGSPRGDSQSESCCEV
jgi:dCMP deaminase